LVIKKSSSLSIFTGLLIIAFSIWWLHFLLMNIIFDYYSYITYYNLIEDSENLKESLNASRFEPGFIFISYYLSNVFSSPEAHYYFVASVCIIIKYSLFVKYIHKPILAWSLYLILFLPALEANQIRTAIATIFVLFMIFQKSDNKKNYILQSVFASLFHYVGSIIIFQSFYKKLSIFFLFLVPLILLVVSNFDSLILYFNSELLPISQFHSKVNIDNNSVNLLSSIHIAQISIIIFGLLNWINFSPNQKKGLFLIIIGSLLYISFVNYPPIAHRVREISLLGIFPLLFSVKIKWNLSYILISLSVFYITCYSVFNIVQRILYYL
jgi:hypothetical protein